MQSDPATPPARSGGAMVSKTLSTVAVLLAIAAVGINFVIPGPMGPQGPAGPGTLMNISFTGATTTIGTACTNYAGGLVSITVPSNGYVFVQAQLWMLISHTAGTDDSGFVVIGNTPTDCGNSYGLWPFFIPAADVTNPAQRVPAFAQRAFVVAAGTSTFYLNAYMQVGQDAADRLWFANMVVMFY